MNSWISTGLNFLGNDSSAVYIAATAIWISSLAGYLLWYRPQAVRLRTTLESISSALKTSADGWPGAKDAASGASVSHPAAKVAWQETEGRVLRLPAGQHSVYVMFGSPRDLWSANRLLSRSINLQLAEAIPNLLVGIGLLFTFFFLTIALTQATAALLPQQGTVSTDLTAATRGLLNAAGAKFMTSLAGLSASILWAFFSRRQMAELNHAVERVLESLARVVTPGGGEMAIYAQLQAARDLQQSGVQQLEATRSLGGQSTQQIEIAEELLNETREQTGTFKRFETDLAVSLANAITSAFSSQMESMTNRLIQAIDGLSDKIGTMNQEALERMLTDFGGMLKTATDSEMTQLRITLEALSTRLNVAGDAIGDGAGRAAEKLDKAGTDLLERVDQVAGSLAAGASNLEGATQGVKEAMNDLDVTISQAAHLGRHGAEFVRTALGTSGELLTRAQSMTEDLKSAGGSLERAGGQLSHAVDSVEELANEQRAVVHAVRDATPEAMASVQRVLDLLQQTVQVTATTMAETKSSMAATSKTLGTTVAEITAGVTEYSQTVADLHRTMDEQMAKALGSIDKGVVSLEEAVEELGEVLSSQTGKA